MDIKFQAKIPPTDQELLITSKSLEEKLFLAGLWNKRCTPLRLIENPDGSVTLVYTY